MIICTCLALSPRELRRSLGSPSDFKAAPGRSDVSPVIVLKRYHANKSVISFSYLVNPAGTEPAAL